MDINEWRREIQRMGLILAAEHEDLKAASEDSTLKHLRQRRADSLNWRKLAYQVADPYLEDLYVNRESAKFREDGHRARSQLDTAWWSKLTAWCAGFGVLLLVINHGLDLSGWVTGVGVLLLIGSLFCAAYAYLAHGDLPDTTASRSLGSRIQAIEEACDRCQDVDDFNAVRSLLEGPNRQSVTKTSQSTDVAPWGS